MSRTLYNAEPGLLPRTNGHEIYDVAIAGGGLAGLSLSIQLAGAGYHVALFEKEKFPFHKVCGEYISLESWNFIQALGLPLPQMNLPVIKRLTVSSPNGKKIDCGLDLGGFGISRYLLDNELFKIAGNKGVYVNEETRVNDIAFANGIFTILTSAGLFRSKTAVGAFGKRSNLDVKWARKPVDKRNGKRANYVAVKYHVQVDGERGSIALHNFKDGYCGLSEIESGIYCLCYLTTAANLKAAGNSIETMEKNILQKNPYLKKIFREAHFLYQSPLTISGISFRKKALVQNNVLMIGDAAGMITPLCGNGMSMAFHSSKIAFTHIDDFLRNRISRKQMEEGFVAEWNNNFAKRLHTGRLIQSVFGKPWLTNVFIGAIKYFPFLIRHLIRATHGKPF